MNDDKWAYKTHWRQAKAIFFTVLFHLLLLGGIGIVSGAKWMDFMPEIVQQWIDTKETSTGPPDDFQASTP